MPEMSRNHVLYRHISPEDRGRYINQMLHDLNLKMLNESIQNARATYEAGIKITRHDYDYIKNQIRALTKTIFTFGIADKRRKENVHKRIEALGLIEEKKEIIFLLHFLSGEGDRNRQSFKFHVVYFLFKGFIRAGSDDEAKDLIDQVETLGARKVAAQYEKEQSSIGQIKKEFTGSIKEFKSNVQSLAKKLKS